MKLSELLFVLHEMDAKSVPDDPDIQINVDGFVGKIEKVNLDEGGAKRITVQVVLDLEG
jgi:hypothetical protein